MIVTKFRTQEQRTARARRAELFAVAIVREDVKNVIDCIAAGQFDQVKQHPKSVAKVAVAYADALEAQLAKDE